MHLIYEDTKEEIIAVKCISRHQSPHLHSTMEIVYVTSGTLELGVGQELYHMEKGDIGFVFPNVIHHYQVFGGGEHEAVYINASARILEKFEDILRNQVPLYPIIEAKKLSSEVNRAIDAIMNTDQQDIWIVQAYLQIILARCIPDMELVDKNMIGSEDLVYRTVAFISANFQESFSLEDMAKNLGVSKYVLSRIFSKIFHKNFNQYLNEVRLGYACQRLENTNDTITKICMDSGFESQRTFNRVFKEQYRISPSEYRKKENIFDVR